MNRLALAFVSLFPVLAAAGPREDAVAQALEQVQEAREEADDATGACKRALKDLGPLSTQLTALKKDATDKGLTRAKELAQDVSEAAKDDCKGSLAKRVGKALDKAVAQLERAQEAKGGSAAPAQTAQTGGNVLVTLAGGIGSLFGGGGSSNTTAHKTETHSSKRTEEINGKPVDDDDDAPPARKSTKAAPSRAGFQATCQHNSDCDSNTCFVGRGELGYCTKMCSSWSECPSHWECKAAANAPQSICMQN